MNFTEQEITGGQELYEHVNRNVAGCLPWERLDRSQQELHIRQWIEQHAVVLQDQDGEPIDGDSEVPGPAADEPKEPEPESPIVVEEEESDPDPTGD